MLEQSSPSGSTNKQVLPLAEMSQRHPGLSPGLAESYLEAARVCLDRHHTPPQDFSIESDKSKSEASVDWEPADERCRLAWVNENDATRDGAYACALAAAELQLGLCAMSRAETLTGADYYVAPPGTKPKDLENCIRLEVSGTSLDIYEVRRRLRDKVVQAEEGNSDLPAIAAVVGFKVNMIVMESVEEAS
jgi:hypothetical protein